MSHSTPLPFRDIPPEGKGSHHLQPPKIFILSTTNYEVEELNKFRRLLLCTQDVLNYIMKEAVVDEIVVTYDITAWMDEVRDQNNYQIRHLMTVQGSKNSHVFNSSLWDKAINDGHRFDPLMSVHIQSH